MVKNYAYFNIFSMFLRVTANISSFRWIKIAILGQIKSIFIVKLKHQGPNTISEDKFLTIILGVTFFVVKTHSYWQKHVLSFWCARAGGKVKYILIKLLKDILLLFVKKCLLLFLIATLYEMYYCFSEITSIT